MAGKVQLHSATQVGHPIIKVDRKTVLGPMQPLGSRQTALTQITSLFYRSQGAKDIWFALRPQHNPLAPFYALEIEKPVL